MSDSLWPHELQHAKLPYPSLSLWVCSNSVLLPGKSHGRRSLVGCSPWGLKELDGTEWLHFHFSLSCIGEGNGNSLQCSCLENPRDEEPGGLPSMGSQSWTSLKWLSSSSSMSIESVMPSNHLIPGRPLTSCCPQSFPALGFFQWVNSRGCFFFESLGKKS